MGNERLPELEMVRINASTRRPTGRLGSVGLAVVVVAIALALLGPGPSLLSASSFHPGAPAVRGAPVPGMTRGAQDQVNPFAYYSSQPAPMGVTDYGVYPGVSPYRYQTAELQGTASLNGFTTWNSSFPSVRGLPADFASLQLNGVFVFDDASGSQYAFWAQTVVYISTATNEITHYRLDLFNFTSPTGMVPETLGCTGSACGTCSVGTTPGSGASCDLPVAVSYVGQPIVLDLLAGAIGGVPSVSFVINGDSIANVTFPWGATLPSAAFSVNGQTVNPVQTAYDAELVIGGPGGSTNTNATGGSMTMVLQYLNATSGLQNVPYAYNFGADTAEGISGVTVSGAVNASGVGAVILTAGSIGSLGAIGSGSTPSSSSSSAYWVVAVVIVAIVVIAGAGYVAVRRRRRPAPPPVPGAISPPVAGAPFPSPGEVPPGGVYGQGVPPTAPEPPPSPSGDLAPPVAPQTEGAVAPAPPAPGAVLPPAFCRGCGSRFDTSDQFCRSCGRPR